MPDNFANHADALIAPARSAYAVTPSDATELPFIPKALYIGGAGALVVRAIDDASDVTLTVIAGALLPIRARFVRATGTTATNIVALD